MKIFNLKKDLFEIVMLLCGSIGLLGALFTSLYFPISALWSFVFIEFYGFLIYFLRKSGKKLQSTHITIWIFVIGIIAMFILPRFNEMLQSLIVVIQRDYFLRFDSLFREGSLLDGFVLGTVFLVISVPIVYSIVNYVIERKNIILKNIVYLLIFIFPLCIRHPVRNPVSYLFIIFLIMEYIFSYLLQNKKCPVVTQVIVIVSLVLTLSFSHLFFSNQVAFQKSSTSALSYITSYFNRDVIKRIVHGNNVTGTNSVASGSLPDDDVVFGNNLALNVHSSKPFGGFIRGYSLATYQDNEWHLPEDEFTTTIPMKTPSVLLDEYGFDVIPTEVTIEPASYVDYQFTVYDSARVERMTMDSYYPASDEPISSIIFDDSYSTVFNEIVYTNRGRTYAISDLDDTSYNEYVDETYKKIPSSLERELYQYIVDHIDDAGITLEELFSQNIYQRAESVKRILQKENKYNLKSGALPDNKDFVLYFLNENKQGSCSHFATAGTLLLRMLNVPARYVTGYLIDKSDFDEEGNAKIYSHRAHAWVEIYQTGMGWIPFEMTPSSRQVTNVANMLDQIQKPSQNADTSSSTNNTTNSTETVNNTTQNTVQEVPLVDKILEYKALIISVAVILILFFGWFILLKILLRIKLSKANSNEKILIYYKRLLKIQKESLPLSIEITQLMQKARFSQYTMTKEEYEKIKQYYHEYYNRVYHTLAWYKKIIMRFTMLPY